MPYKIFSFLIAFFAFSFTASAQSSASTDDIVFEPVAIELTSTIEDDWTFYLDAENKVYYIDFETISVNLNDVQVTNEDGEVVLEDNLWDLPVNTIYELDFNEMTPGKYKVELRTYTGKITKEVNIAE